VNVVPDWGASEPEPEVIVVPDREGPLENMSLELWLKAKGAPDLLQGFKELGINTMMDMGFRVQTEKDMEMLGMTPEQIKESWPDVMKMKTKVADRGKTPAPDTRAAATRKNPYPEYDKIRAERVRIREGPKRSWDTTKPGTALEQEMINAELMDAIRDQDLTAVKAALEKGARENYINSSNLTPLQTADYYMKNTIEHTTERQIAEGIMDHLIGVFVINSTVTHNAVDKQIYQERLDLFEELPSAADKSMRAHQVATAKSAELMDAIRDQDLTAVKAALEKGARENAVQFSSQLTPLQRAYDYTENTTEHTKEWRIAEGIMDHLIGVFMINGTQPNAADKQIYQERLALFGIV